MHATTRKGIEVRARITVALVAILVGGSLAAAAARADAADVTLTVNIRPTVAASVVDGVVTVRANTDWALEAIAADGSVVRTEGSRTSGTAVALPAGTGDFTVIPEG